ncbi:MAG: DUF2288 domain-containing protein [Limnothrix sp. BL-A-16]|jgi:hypothetical protein
MDSEPSNPNFPADDSSSGNLRSSLTESIDLAEWDWLKPHIGRDAVIVVTPDLDLAEVGEALASDNTAVVQRWIDEQAIAKPTQAELAEWDRSGNARFQAMIVAPFVLVKLITD